MKFDARKTINELTTAKGDLVRIFKIQRKWYTVEVNGQKFEDYSLVSVEKAKEAVEKILAAVEDDQSQEAQEEVESKYKPLCYVENNEIKYADVEDIRERKAKIRQVPTNHVMINRSGLLREAKHNTWLLENTFLDDLHKAEYNPKDDTTRYFLNLSSVVDDLIAYMQ